MSARCQRILELYWPRVGPPCRPSTLAGHNKANRSWPSVFVRYRLVDEMATPLKHNHQLVDRQSVSLRMCVWTAMKSHNIYCTEKRYTTQSFPSHRTPCHSLAASLYRRSTSSSMGLSLRPAGCRCGVWWSREGLRCLSFSRAVHLPHERHEIKSNACLHRSTLGIQVKPT